jgi:hypothetical protein
VYAALSYKPPRHWSLRTTLIGEVIDIAAPEEAPHPVPPPVLTDNAESIGASFPERSIENVHSSMWDAILAANQACAGSGAEPHVVIYLPQHTGTFRQSDSPRFSSEAAAAPLHCIAHSAEPVLQEICERNRGSYHLVEDEAEVARVLEWLYFHLIARYQVSYPNPGRHTTPELEIRTPEGAARSHVRLRHSTAREPAGRG